MSEGLSGYDPEMMGKEYGKDMREKLKAQPSTAETVSEREKTIKGEEKNEEKAVFEAISSKAEKLYIAIERYKSNLGIEEDKIEKIVGPLMGEENAERMIALVEDLFNEHDKGKIKTFDREMSIFRGILPNEYIVRELEELKKNKLKLGEIKIKMRQANMKRFNFLEKPLLKSEEKKAKGRKEERKKTIMDMAKNIDLVSSDYRSLIKEITGIISNFVTQGSMENSFSLNSEKIKEKFNFLILGTNDKEEASIDWKKFYQWCESKLLVMGNNSLSK